MLQFIVPYLTPSRVCPALTLEGALGSVVSATARGKCAETKGSEGAKRNDRKSRGGLVGSFPRLGFRLVLGGGKVSLQPIIGGRPIRDRLVGVGFAHAGIVHERLDHRGTIGAHIGLPNRIEEPGDGQPHFALGANGYILGRIGWAVA